MDVTQATARFAFLPVRLRIVPRQVLKLPALNKSNTLRGAFGMAFRRLVCIPQCREARLCPLGQTCPYKIIFEPAPPPGAERLSKNQDIPRPFIFRPPPDAPPDVGCSVDLRSTVGGRRPPLQDVAPDVAPGGTCPDAVGSPARAALKDGATRTTYAPGEPFDFTLTLMGKAVDFLPYFILAFREVAREGIGLNRAQCTLETVEQIGFGVRDLGLGTRVSGFGVRDSGLGIRGSGLGETNSPIRNLESGISNPVPCNLSPVTSLIYTAADQLFRAPQAFTLGDYVQARLAQLSTFDSRRSTANDQLATLNYQLSTVFLTPTYLKSEGQAVRQPEFHHLFKSSR